MKLIQPYGGKLVDLVAQGQERVDLLARAGELASVQLNSRALCDLELLSAQSSSPEESAKRIVNYLVDQGFIHATSSSAFMSFDAEALSHAAGAQPLIET